MAHYIDQEEIYRLTDGGLTIFQYYFPGIDFYDARHKFKIRESERTPSAHCRLFGNRWRITDFGNQGEVNALNAIDWVIYREGLIYIDALKFIAKVIIRKEISSGNYDRPLYRADYSQREVGPDDHKGEYRFIFKEPDKELEAIGRYVTAEHLKLLHGKVVEQYEFVGKDKKKNKDVVHIFKATKDYPIFLFDYGKFKKIYKPHELDKKFRFLYVGQKPKDFIYGLDLLEQMSEGESEFFNAEKGDNEPPQSKPDAVVKNLFRVSGESDALNLLSIGYRCYWLNSETARFERDTYNKVDKYCERHFQIMDLDETGLRSAQANALKHMNLYTVELPQHLKYKKDWRGNRCKDMKDFINIVGRNEDETRTEFAKLIRRAKPMKFWEKTTELVKGKAKTTYNINLEYYYHFLMMHGFFCMDSKYHKKAGYCYARINEKIVDLIHPDDIKKIAKRFTKEWIKSRNLIDEIEILNKINSSNQISENNLQELSFINPQFKNYDKEFDTLVFQNTVFHITAKEIKKIKHTDLPNYILGELLINNDRISHVIPHKCTLLKQSPITVEPTEEYASLLKMRKMAKTTDERAALNAKIYGIPEYDRYVVKINDPNFIFVQFLRDISRIYWRKEDEQKIQLTATEKKEEMLLLANLLFFLGYQLQQYKDPGRPWMGFIQDLKISEIGKSSGRSGKSLLSMAIKHTRPRFYVPGRNRNSSVVRLKGRNRKIADDQFIYDGYTRFHNNIEIDDLHEFADMDFFYTQITGPRRINTKHLSPEVLEYEDSGKMYVSTNYELPNTDNSTIARLLFTAVSDYYHEKTKYNNYRESRSPLTKFGKRLFDDFTPEEWNKFYNLMAYSIQMVMRFEDKINPPMRNIEKRQLRRAMIKGVTKDEEFLKWADSYFIEKPPYVDLVDDISPDDIGYLDTFIIRENAFNSFRDTLSDQIKRKFTKQRFMKSLHAWAQYYDYVFNPESLIMGKTNRIIRKVSGKTTECIYIATKPFNVKELTREQEEKMPF